MVQARTHSCGLCYKGERGGACSCSVVHMLASCMWVAVREGEGKAELPWTR